MDDHRCDETYDDRGPGPSSVDPRTRPEFTTRPCGLLNAYSSEGFHHDRLAERWDGGEPMRLDRTVIATINRFTPQKVPEEVWQRVEGFVRTAVTMAGPETPFIADHEMTVVA